MTILLMGRRVHDAELHKRQLLANQLALVPGGFPVFDFGFGIHDVLLCVKGKQLSPLLLNAYSRDIRHSAIYSGG